MKKILGLVPWLFLFASASNGLASIASDFEQKFRDSSTQAEYIDHLAALEDTLNRGVQEQDLFELLDLLPFLEARAQDLNVYDEIDEPLGIVQFLISENLVDIVSISKSPPNTLSNFLAYGTTKAIEKFLTRELSDFSSLNSAQEALELFKKLSNLVFKQPKQPPQRTYMLVDDTLSKMVIELLSGYQVSNPSELEDIVKNIFSDEATLSFLDYLLNISLKAKYYSNDESFHFIKLLATSEANLLKARHLSDFARRQIEITVGQYLANFIPVMNQELLNLSKQTITSLSPDSMIEVAYQFMNNISVPANSKSAYGYVGILRIIYERLSVEDIDPYILAELDEFTRRLPVYLFTHGITDGYYKVNIEGESYGLSVIQTSTSQVAATLSNNYEVYSFHSVTYSFQADKFIFNAYYSPTEPRSWSLTFSLKSEGVITGSLISQGQSRRFEGFLKEKYQDFSDSGAEISSDFSGVFSNTQDTGQFKKAVLQINGIGSGLGASLVLTTNSNVRVVVNFSTVSWSKKEGVLYLTTGPEKNGPIIQLRGVPSNNEFYGEYIVGGREEVISLLLYRQEDFS